MVPPSWYVAPVCVRPSQRTVHGGCVQAKEGGRKVVAVISSSEASVSPVATASRDIDAPPGPFDAMLPSYRASKAALNRCECPNRLKHYKGFRMSVVELTPASCRSIAHRRIRRRSPSAHQGLLNRSPRQQSNLSFIRAMVS